MHCRVTVPNQAIALFGGGADHVIAGGVEMPHQVLGIRGARVGGRNRYVLDKAHSLCITNVLFLLNLCVTDFQIIDIIQVFLNIIYIINNIIN